MSSESRCARDRYEAADESRTKRRSRGRRVKIAEPPEDSQSFEDYASGRLSSFLRAELVMALAGYIVMLAGGAWFDDKDCARSAFICTAPVVSMTAALAVAWPKGPGARASIAALVFIAALEVGVVLRGLRLPGSVVTALPVFVLIPLTVSPVLQRRWDFPLAAALSVAGPLALLVLRRPSGAEEFGFMLSIFIAISTAAVTNLFALRSQKESFRLERQLRSFADIDDLTQLPRRRRVLELGRRMVHRAERAALPLSVLYIDADRFKSVNDRFGHDAGDRALRLIACQIQESIRPSDVAGRFGGEEFVVLLPATGHVDAARVAERLRRDIEDIRQFEVTLTISVGVAQHVPSEPLECVIRRADAALLHAKDGGRNRVAIAERLAERGADDGHAQQPAPPDMPPLCASGRSTEPLSGLTSG
jgi:diguanylate cyclase (GGDEF)-like protein